MDISSLFRFRQLLGIITSTENSFMSANNMITINKKTFVVMNVDAEMGYGSEVGKGKSLEEAVDIAQRELDKGEVEYGIHFVEKEE